MQRQPAVADRGPDAGHCTDGTAVARLWFDENVQNNSEYPFGEATSYEGTPYPNPGFCIGCGNGLPGFAQRGRRVRPAPVGRPGR